MLKIISYIVFLFCAFNISIEVEGQHIRKYSQNSGELSFAENLEIAEELFQLQLYYPAMGYYEKAKSMDSIDLKYTYQLAECYRKLRYYYEASESYRQVWEKDSDSFPEALLYQGTMSLADGDLHAAQEILSKYNLQNKNGDEAISSYAEMQLDNVAFAMEGIKKQNKIDIEGLNKAINQPQTTFSTFKDDEKLFYSSAIAVSRSLLQNYPGFKGVFDTVYVNRLWQCVKENDQWADRQMIEIEAESEFLSVGSPFWVESQKRLYYTACSDVDEKKPCQIYYSNLNKNGNWSKGIALGSNVNGDNSSTKHPMILETNDGQIIFFASNRGGGQGGFDLWYAKIDKLGNISRPENLGSAVNTPYDEVTPFLHEKSRNLFFSSNGHKGFGELDVFMIRLDLAQKTGKLYHLDYPINSTADDYYFSLNDDGYGGFLSSNRSSDLFASYLSYADKLYKIKFQPAFPFHELPNYITEINSFSQSEAKFNLFNEEFAYQYLDASKTALDRMNENDVAFSGQMLLGEDPSANRNVLLENEKGEIVGQATTDENGHFEFRNLPPDGSYMLVLSEEDAGMTVFLNHEDQHGNTVSSLNSKESNAFYTYKNLDNYLSSLDKMEAYDVAFSGQLLLGEDPSANRNVLLENEKGEIVGQATTDENGNFEFKNLPPDGSYMLVLSEDDTDMTVFLNHEDQHGNTVSSLNSKESNAFYTYKNLDNYLSSLDKMEAYDVAFSGQLLLGEDPSANRNVLLENEQGEIVGQATTDENGNFEFRNLPPDGSYMLVLSEDDADMTVFLNHEDQHGNTVSSLNSEESNGFYTYKNLDNYLSSLDQLEENDVEFSGQLSFGGGPSANRNILLENENGEFIAQTMSDENGHFEFKGLPADGTYMLVLSEDDSDMTIDLNYKDQNGNTLSSLNSEESNAFYSYKNLDNYFSDVNKFDTDDTSLFVMNESNIKKHLKPFMSPVDYSNLESRFNDAIYDDILIRVQIGAYRHPKPGLFEHMEEIGKVDEDYVDDMTKFLIGKFNRIAEAEPLRVSAYVMGIEDAFIAVYYKGKRVSAIYY